MTRANVSYHLRQLEKALGAELIRRTSRRMEPTELGWRLCEHGRAIRNEMALTLDDVLSRRTRARIINRRATLASARQVAELMATELHWDSAEIDRQVAFFVDSCSREEAAGMVSEAEFLASVQ
jgi:DNA-binding transcriptional LysR family regulator